MEAGHDVSGRGAMFGIEGSSLQLQTCWVLPAASGSAGAGGRWCWRATLAPTLV